MRRCIKNRDTSPLRQRDSVGYGSVLRPPHSVAALCSWASGWKPGTAGWRSGHKNVSEHSRQNRTATLNISTRAGCATLFSGPLIRDDGMGDVWGEILFSGELLRKHWGISRPAGFSLLPCWKPDLSVVPTGRVWVKSKPIGREHSETPTSIIEIICLTAWFML